MNGERLNIKVWQNKLGLFPMPLFYDKPIEEKSILLNGGIRGNFCLDYRNENTILARSDAWSSNVGHYLIVDNQNISVYRWDTFKHETYQIQSVENKLESFYSYLRKQEINKQDSIIKFVIQFYRQIRTILRDDIGNDSLNVLLYFFACISDNANRDQLVINNWSLN